ncbi:hypothetical protein GOBAR_DD05133 [Gossypium barbadense]|nr:hypothetical protein GOBAR_DD05133 [Gossypium barbadense]
MDWCCSSTPRTPEYRTMNEERHARKGKAYWLVIMRPQFLTGGDTKGLRPSIPWIDREREQSSWFFHVVKELNNGFFDASAAYITALPLDRRKSSGITKYGTLGAHSIVKREDVIEYR